MANSPQAKKRIRSSEARTLVNKNRRSRIRTFVKKVEGALEAGDKSTAEVALKEAQPEIQRGVTKGLIHKNTAARKISRLARQINNLG